MRRQIAILFTYHEQIELNTPLSEVTFQDVFKFNKNETYLLGVIKSFGYDAMKMYLTHPEFEPVQEACRCPHFYLEDARRRYPFLFADTNPILYRKFNV